LSKDDTQLLIMLVIEHAIFWGLVAAILMTGV
jgi:hypothetical protein